MKNVCSSVFGFFFTAVIFCLLINNQCTAQDNKTNFTPLTIEIDGSKISAKFFMSSEEKLSPTLILVQGYPGNENDVLGIAASLKEKGINSLVFNYRGSFKSEGLFSVENAISDVVKTVEFIKKEETVKSYNVDTTNITVIGYCFGAGIAIQSSKLLPAGIKFVFIAPSNSRLTAEKIESDSVYRKNHLRALKSGEKFFRSKMTPEENQKWLIEHKQDIDLFNSVDILSKRKILLIGGWNDNLAPIEEHLIPFYRVFQKTSTDCRMLLLEADHPFKNALPELHNNILEWIRK